MVRLLGSFSRLCCNKVLLVGDFVLDVYTRGKVRRVSPEAPVSILQVESEERLPGMAGNVALNLVSLGSQVIVLGRVGDDFSGRHLIQALAQEGVETSWLLTQSGYETPIKNRLLAENQQIIRVDFERIEPIPEDLESKIIAALPDLLQDVGIIAISDYGKGFLTKKILSEILRLAKAYKIPTIIDPKGSDFSKYSGATVIKPNLSEAIAASTLPANASLDQIAAKLLHETQVEAFVITRSEQGISLFFKEGRRADFPVRVREIKDVTGAGDTVLAFLTCAMASGLSLEEAAPLANVTAGIALERVGCARVTLSQLARRLLEEDTVNKLFDQEHLMALQAAIRGRWVTLLSIDGHQGFSTVLFRNIRKLSESKKGELILYVRNAEGNKEFIDLLASLHEVNFIVIKNDSLRHLCEHIAPNELYFLQGDQLVAETQEVWR